MISEMLNLSIEFYLGGIKMPEITLVRHGQAKNRMQPRKRTTII